MESSEIDPYKYGPLITDKGAKVINGESLACRFQQMCEDNMSKKEEGATEEKEKE